ncbi:MAG TPA: metabolite traffic protein EboE [Kiritimatiellia bacterium]|nr:metabolite traffic protein EboE [Kiritimatiellia bacterium]
MTPFPVSFCLNACDASTWKAAQKSLDAVVPAVKALIAPNRPFPVSLHLGNRALREARSRAADLRKWLDDHGCFLAALNAFPYGRFQNVRVKTKVYRPNWTDPDRLAYTRRAIAFLSGFLPEGETGTVTTVPGGWSGDWISPDDDREALKNLRKAADCCREVEGGSGRRIRLAIEPEPGCAWDLFDRRLAKLGPAVGWCLDTCHAAVEFRSIEKLDWTRIVRVQLSAAIECDNTPAARAALAPFAEPRFLHQTRAALDGEIIGEWPDLTDALADLPKLPKSAVVRTHYHVPLTWKGSGPLRSTRSLLTPAFFRQARGAFCEVETYTYSVLPESVRPRPLAESIAAELRWAARRYGPSSSSNRKTVSPGLA